MGKEDNLNQNGIDQHDLAYSTYQLFVQSMESHYSEIIKFLAIIVPSFTGFFFVLVQYESAETGSKPFLMLFFVTFITIAIQVWGAIYALAMSYRFRYLQASVNKIEEARGVAPYLPRSFKPKPLNSIGSRLSLSIAPVILQVHAFFFVFSAMLFSVISCIVIESCQYKVLTIILGVIAVSLILMMGSWYFPNKLNAILTSLEENVLPAKK